MALAGTRLKFKVSMKLLYHFFCKAVQMWQTNKPWFHFQIHHYGQLHLPKPLSFPLVFAYSTGQRLGSGRHRHPDPGLHPGLPGEPFCGLVGAVSGEEALGDLHPGAESGPGGRFRAPQRAAVTALPGWGAGLGVRVGHLQAAALPVQREHVRVHLPHLPDEHGPLAGRHQALPVPENADQKVPAGLADGSLDFSVRLLPADAFLPQVKCCPAVFLFVRVVVFFYTISSSGPTAIRRSRWPTTSR